MDSEKYPLSFVVALSIYFAMLVITLAGFFLPALTLNLWEDSGFYIISLIIFGPAILALIYWKSSRFVILWSKEKALRYIVIALCILSIVFQMIFILPLI